MVDLRNDEFTAANNDKIMMEIIADFKSFTHI